MSVDNSTTQKSYNPFTSAGRENIKHYAVKNKSRVLMMAGLVLLLIFASVFFIYESGPKTVNTDPGKPDITEPEYGNGPFGWGLYLPPKAILEKEIPLLE